jgi:hypothetical protein
MVNTAIQRLTFEEYLAYDDGTDNHYPSPLNKSLPLEPLLKALPEIVSDLFL